MPLDSTQLSLLVAQLARDGMTLWVQDGQLKFRAPRGGLRQELRDRLVENRDALIQYLSTSPEKARAAGREHPLSHMQQRLWFLKQVQPGLAAYNIPITARVRGRLDVSALEAALDTVTQRHESLRTYIAAEDGVPHCVVEPHVRVEVQTSDVSAADNPEQRAHEAVVELVNRPFGSSDRPLVRALLVRLGADHHVLCMVVDHLIADGLSLNILLGELFSAYAGLAQGGVSSLPPLTQQYADFVAWQQQRLEDDASARILQYWRGKLAGVPPFLQLPADKPRPPVQTYAGDHLSTLLPQGLSRQLRELARLESATLFMVLMAGFQALLQRLCGQSDIPVGTAVANRGDGRFDQVIGFFANNIVMRGDLSGNPTMRELIARTRQVALEAYANEELQFDRLVEALAPVRGLDRSPIFQVMFVLRSERGGVNEFAGLQFDAVDSGLHTARFDLSVDAIERDEGIRLVFEYNTDLFLPTSIAAMVERYRRILESMAARPGVRLSELPVLDGDELRALQRMGGGPQLEAPAASFVAAFQDRYAQHAGAVAITCRHQSLTYTELNAAANRLAHALRAGSVGRGSTVAVCMERSAHLAVALLGIQKSGAAYVPLDPGFPTERLQYMLADSGATVLLTADDAASHIQLPAQARVVDLVRQSDELRRQPEADLHHEISPEDPVYVIYTSGSTGRPKGVVVSHGSLMNFLNSMAREPGMSQSDVLAAVTTISFDIAALELYLPLLAGARIELLTREEAIDGQALAARLASSGATVLQATPATWRLLIESGWRGAPGFRALCGGEALPKALAEALAGRVSELWNLYGPTETTVWSTLDRVRPGETITVGRPIANTQVYVLGDSMERMPVGSAGEIWIGGMGVALGYHQRPELTAERFVTDPFSDVPGARLYRTGDLGRWNREGRLEHLGRADGQVKIRGYRIELGEIEAVMEGCAGVSQAAVIVRNAGTGDERLVGCLVLVDADSAALHGVRTRLSEALPDYMVPRELVCLESLPLTANGKVDRNQLSRMQIAPVGAPVRAPTPETAMSRTQQRVADLWRQVLQTSQVGLHENFFDLGGHSLLLARLQAAIKREFEVELPLVALFQYTTVAAQAQQLAPQPATQLENRALDRARARAARQKNV